MLSQCCHMICWLGCLTILKTKETKQNTNCRPQMNQSISKRIFSSFENLNCKLIHLQKIKLPFCRLYYYNIDWLRRLTLVWYGKLTKEREREKAFRWLNKDECDHIHFLNAKPINYVHQYRFLFSTIQVDSHPIRSQ